MEAGVPAQVSTKKTLIAMPLFSSVACGARDCVPSDSGLGCHVPQGKVSPNTPQNTHAGVSWDSGLSLVHLGPPPGIPAGGISISF